MQNLICTHKDEKKIPRIVVNCLEQWRATAVHRQRNVGGVQPLSYADGLYHTKAYNTQPFVSTSAHLAE